MYKRLCSSIALIAFCTLVLELTLVRVFDVILTPNMGYAVITASVFALGLGGIYLYVFPLSKQRAIAWLPWLFVIFAAACIVLQPVLNFLPFDLNMDQTGLRAQIPAWLAMYLMLILPFFIAGLIISIILTHYSKDVHTLYFFDLLGAGLGCALIIPLLKPYGPGGIQLVVAALSLLGAVLMFQNTKARLLLLAVAVGLAAFPATQDGYLEYRGHANKRGVDAWKAQGLRRHIEWDPVSKLEVFSGAPNALNFALDGGQQGSWLRSFPTTVEAFQEAMKADPGGYHGMNSVVHYLNRDKLSDADNGGSKDVLIIGAAVGGETLASLIFGADKVDAIELVGAMVNAAKTQFADFSGHVFNHPKVNYRVGEGRTFLRASDHKYDIIQMFSNHTSSSIADGSGAVATAYLQTSEAYKEYFTHLKDDGMMQINHHLYPRMLTTAAKAWRELGRQNFDKHVLVVERWSPDTLPTMLIRVKPWTQEQVDEVLEYMNRENVYIQYPQHGKMTRVIYAGQDANQAYISRKGGLSQLNFFVETFEQDGLSGNIRIDVTDAATNKPLGFGVVKGGGVKDKSLVTMTLDQPIQNVRNRKLMLKISSDIASEDKGFALRLTPNGRIMLDTRDKPGAFLVVFNPLTPEQNLISAEFLQKPFQREWIRHANHDFSPVTDNNPYFSMIRRHRGWVWAHQSENMDGGTAQFLNMQQQKFMTADWASLVMVGGIASVFSVIFILVPLIFSRYGRTRWNDMSSYLVYFSCLGAGFILIELVFVQIFKKLIGYPIHTYITVIFSLLISAGLGSWFSQHLRLLETGRWRWVFWLILALGALFVLSYSAVFHIFLAQPLATRIAVAVALLLPIGFVMGMPLPLALHKLGKVAPEGIPWAWGMNGFFTVFGGFLSVMLSVLFGFQVVLTVGFAIYALAFLIFARIQRKSYGF